MTTKPKPVPEGFHTITPYLHVEGAAKLIDFMKEAFAAQEIGRVPRPDGTVIHAEIKIGDSMIEMGDAPSQPAAIHLYVEDADAVYERALRAGAVSLNGPTDQPYGDREAAVRDPFGNNWYIATHKLTGKPIPEGLRTITPYLQLHGAAKLIDFLTRAFDAEVAGRYDAPDGTIAHAKIKVGDSMVEMGEAHGELGPMTGAIHLYVNDTDAVFRSAIEAGAASLFEPRDEPYGDRVGGVTDPAGNTWYIATHIKDVTM
ncbi:MAG TPA: VOC family protein [Blastocatellia bacterium]|nr:VOC family protein [Blastocatellia bacterium]